MTTQQNYCGNLLSYVQEDCDPGFLALRAICVLVCSLIAISYSSFLALLLPLFVLITPFSGNSVLFPLAFGVSGGLLHYSNKDFTESDTFQQKCTIGTLSSTSCLVRYMAFFATNFYS